MHVRNRFVDLWRNMSIRVKSFLLISILLIAMWVLVLIAMFQLRMLSEDSSIIMDDYIDVTEFMTAFSNENLALEAYIRPSAMDDAKSSYLDAMNETDIRLKELTPNIETDVRNEYVLKQSISHSMTYFRQTQEALLNGDSDELIETYLSLSTQAAYIDGYARSLLNLCMSRGNAQWQEIQSANEKNLQRFIFLLFGSTIMMIGVLLIFTKSILRPLTDLSRAADRIRKGKYDGGPLPVRSNDELGKAAASFNKMQMEINKTVSALEEKSEMERHLREKEVREAQMRQLLQEERFAQLQSQINPHFLFNILSTIAAFAREETAPLTEDLILRLSRFFRYSLENDERIVSLGREISLLKDYIELQETRYEDRISMDVEWDESLTDISVPKFILQPLVENSIMHGLHECISGGRIRIRARRFMEKIVITVTDNGCGFDTKNTPRSAHTSIGIVNIAERMHLVGGNFSIYSRPGMGTCAKIIINEDLHE
ncbi:MAG: histidine kinase [Lachnospiraceae bacterium]|nr:histidine kinase [Lachnospiraceae bacterium]